MNCPEQANQERHRVVVARREEGAEGEMLKGDPLHDDEWKLNLR